MAYPMVHLLTAFETAQQCGVIHNLPAFLLGSLAPDSVQFREDYHYTMKEKSHAWACGPRWGEVEDSEKWLRDIQSFYRENRSLYDRDFMLGYITHLLTDWLMDVEIWQPLLTEQHSGLIPDADKRYHKECYKTDYELFAACPYQEKLWSALKLGTVDAVPPVIPFELVFALRDSILYEQFAAPRENGLDGYLFCSPERMRCFINSSVQHITKWLQKEEQEEPER